MKMVAMTVQEVYNKLEQLIKEGKGSKPCLFAASLFMDLPIESVEYYEKSAFVEDAVYFENVITVGDE